MQYRLPTLTATMHSEQFSPRRYPTQHPCRIPRLILLSQGSWNIPLFRADESKRVNQRAGQADGDQRDRGSRSARRDDGQLSRNAPEQPRRRAGMATMMQDKRRRPIS